MLYILLSALSSICAALLLKQARLNALDTLQLIGWNYGVALLLCVTILQPVLPASGLAHLPWHWLTLLAVLLPLVFVFYSQSLARAGVIATEIAQRLSLVIALIAAFWVFGDRITLVKISGASLGVIAVLMLVSQRSTTPVSSPYPLIQGAGLLLLLVWLGYGVIDVLLKSIAQTGVAFSAALALSFLLAFAGMLALMLYRHHQRLSPMTWQHFGGGVLLGAFNFANISLYIKAHQVFSNQPAVVFASMNIAVVVMGTLAGAILYKESLKPNLIIALVISIAAIGLLAMSR